MKNKIIYAICSVVLMAACGGGSTATKNVGASTGGDIPKSLHSMAYAVATVEKYPPPLALIQHGLGDAVEADLKTAGWSGSRYKDDMVTPALFIGHHEFPDLMVYGGHGTHYGPSFPMDTEWSMNPSNYFWGESPTKPLRWMINDSCAGLNDGVVNPTDPPRWEPVEGSYWHLGVWEQSMNWGNGGTHAYLAHRGLAWANQPGTGASFTVRQSLRGESIGQAWFDAAAMDIAQGVSGEVPAILSAYDPATGKDWFNESLKDPWNDPSPSVRSQGGYPVGDHSNLAYHFAIYGTPALPPPLIVSQPVDGQFHGAPIAVGDALDGILGMFMHRIDKGEGTDDGIVFEVDGVGPKLDQFLVAFSQPKQVGEMMHMVQRGYSPVVLVDKLLSMRTKDGKALLIRVNADSRVVGGRVSGNPKNSIPPFQ